MSPLISIANLNKFYGRTKVVNDVNLTVSAGQILGLVGPNGAGKTTCLHALLGLADYEGEIDVLGLDPRKQREEMLKKVSYISDVAVLPKWLKVSQAIDYMAGVHPNFNREQALVFLAKTNIKHSAKVKELSKGMVTQLHLALILAVDAKVLVLDEPTLGLDILTRRQFYTHLLEDFYQEDRCIIVTTHQIEEIEHILTDVAFIQNGHIVLAESTDEIKQRFKMLAVTSEHIEQAQQLNPLYSNSIMGVTTMLFDGVSIEKLSELGRVNSPTLADIFVGVMTKETNS
ncbi:ABC transporter ATP-binding protein [Thalassotalea profundi]|uniref:ABC transporter ATP-binding protein n=1 Tax=Thalassotalea profundi TaxID=2036687 RepID=A0ABQ3ILA6_9GAMM|nr:ABC transporter ATP-binding protein [Thalassotalea profundi]GHE84927.1 ABC transporter ATP-binding protein [Thalassotalea profundi]